MLYIPRPRFKYIVLKAPKPSEVWGTNFPYRTTYGEEDVACPVFHVGQEILTEDEKAPEMWEGRGTDPAGKFCPFVWTETYWIRQVLGGGGSFNSPVWPATSLPPDEHKVLFACSDATRPVILKIEKIEE